MANTLDELYTKSPGTQQVASTPNAESSSATAGNATASTYNAQTQDVPTENLTSSRLNTITSQDSPLMQRARQEGMLLAARRGLQNSSLAAGQAQGALVDRAAPIAGQEADILQGQRLANQQATNTASQFNAGSETDVSKLNAQLGTQTSLQNAQNATETSRFNAETAAQKAQQDAQAENAMRTAVMNQNAELNKQYLSGTQAQDLATIQAQYQALIQSNASAANLYNTYFQTISQVMSNPNIDPARIAQIVGTLQQSLVGGMDFLNAMSSIGGGTSGAPMSGVPAPAGAGVAAASTGSPSLNPSVQAGMNRFYPTPRIPAQGIQTFNAAGGEAATTGNLSNARNVLAAGFAAQPSVPAASPTTDAPTATTDQQPTLPPGVEASGYGGLLSNAGALASAAGGKFDSSLLSGAGKVASGAGGALQVVGGVQQGGTAGYGSAIAGAAQLAGTLGYGGTATGVAGAVGNALAGNYLGAAHSLGSIGSSAAAGSSTGAAAAGSAASGTASALSTLSTGAGYAAAVIAAGQLIHQAFNAHGSLLRNRAAFETLSKDWQPTQIGRIGAKGMFAVTAYNVPGVGWVAMTQGQYDELAGNWYGAAVAPDGNQEEWQKKLANTISNLIPINSQTIGDLKKKWGGSWDSAAIQKIINGG